MKEIETDIAIVGSGAGGATVAKELTEHGKNVLILEKGGEELSLIKKAFIKYHDGSLIRSVCKKIIEPISINRNLYIQRRIGIGGTTTIAAANAVRSLEKELYSSGVSIKDELQEIEQELEVTLFPENLMGKGAQKIWDAANSLGLTFEPMPKFIDFNKCIGCGKCNVKCPTGAKWTGVNFIKKAQNNGASLLQNVMVSEVLTSNCKVVGLKALSPKGEICVHANIVVLAAGAIESAIILQKTGIKSAGKKLFCDPCYWVCGPSKSDSYDEEPISLMDSEFLHKDGFSLLNCVIKSRNGKYFSKSKTEKGMLSVMFKIKDDPNGSVQRDGNIKKTLTHNDLSKQNTGVQIAKEILAKVGINPRYIELKGPVGFHPGGTAAIGEVVDQNQETEVKNLFVSDASVLPTSPGLPLMLTIMALSKRLSKRLVTMM